MSKPVDARLNQLAERVSISMNLLKVWRHRYKSAWIMTEAYRLNQSHEEAEELLYFAKGAPLGYWDAMTYLMDNGYLHAPTITNVIPFLKIPKRFN